MVTFQFSDFGISHDRKISKKILRIHAGYQLSIFIKLRHKKIYYHYYLKENKGHFNAVFLS